jgi:hypothetical protein
LAAGFFLALSSAVSSFFFVVVVFFVAMFNYSPFASAGTDSSTGAGRETNSLAD